MLTDHFAFWYHKPAMVQGTGQCSLTSPLKPGVVAVELMICAFLYSNLATQIRVELGLRTSEASHGINMTYLPEASL